MKINNKIGWITLFSAMIYVYCLIFFIGCNQQQKPNVEQEYSKYFNVDTLKQDSTIKDTLIVSLLNYGN